MGLDMFLYQKKAANPEVDGMLKTRRKGEAVEDDAKVSTPLTQEVGYWRKANQIHNWFVNNVQEGVDNCDEYKVSREKLSDLLEVVNQVLENSKLIPGKVSAGQTLVKGKWVDNIVDGNVLENQELAERLLPTQSGFFFGSCNYDEWYLDDLRQTKEILEKALALPPDTEFFYQSSW